jgi:hypothetical protein
VNKKDDDVMRSVALGGAILIDPSREPEPTEAPAPEAPAPKPEAKLTDTNEALREAMRTAFHDLCSFTAKEVGTMRKFLKSATEAESLPADQIIKVATLLLARAERYKAAKQAFREGGLIVRPDSSERSS